MENFSHSRPPVDRGDTARWVAQLPFEEIQHADKACEQFAAHLQWPDLVPSVAAQIRVRLEGALAVCKAGGLTLMGALSRREAIATLLVDFWHRKGIEWTEEVYGR